MSWYTTALKEIDGYNEHWRSKLVEAWTEGDVYNWLASSSRLTLVPVEALPFEQFRHITGKQLVKWKVSNFVHKDAKNGVFLYLYLQDIIAHHKGKACRNDLVPVVVGVTSQVEPSVKEELLDENVRVSDGLILHTNTWRKKNLSDWTGLDVYHWLLHLCKENSIPLDKFPFTEFEDFDGMRLLLLSGNDYAMKSSDYGIFIYQSINQLILHYSDSTLNKSAHISDHNEDEFATIFTSSSNSTTTTDSHQYYIPSSGLGNYCLNPAPSYNDFSTAQHASNLPLTHSNYATLQDKTIKSEPTYSPPHRLYSASPLEYMHHHHRPPSPVKYEPNVDVSSHYPLDGYANHRNYHERMSTLTNMDNPPPDQSNDSKSKMMQYAPISIKLELESSAHQYSCSPNQYSSPYSSPSHHRTKSPIPFPTFTHHVPYNSNVSAQFSNYPHSVPSTLQNGDFDTSAKANHDKPNKHYESPSHTLDKHRSLHPTSSSHGNDLISPTCQDRNEGRRPATNKHKTQTGPSPCTPVKEKLPHQPSDKMSPAKKKSTSSTSESKGHQTSEISKSSNVPYSLVTAHKSTTKITIKFASNTSGAPSWRGKQVKLWTNEDVKAWCRTIAPDIGLPASKFPHHLFSEDLDGPKLLEMKKSDFVKKYQRLGENVYGKLEELIVSESCYDSGSDGSTAQTSGSGTSDGNPDDRVYPSSDDNSESEEEEENSLSVVPEAVNEASSVSVPELPAARRRPGRPKGVTNRNTRKKEKLGKVWQFLINLLHNPEYNPSLICWEKYDEGKFRFVQSDKVAALWGDTKRNETYNYEKFSRAMRYYYKHDILRSVDGRLIYQFGANAVGWRIDNPIDPGERITLNSSVSRAARQLSLDPSRHLSRQDTIPIQHTRDTMSRELSLDPVTRQLNQDPNRQMIQDPNRQINQDPNRQMNQDPNRHLNRPDLIPIQHTRDTMPRELSLDPITRQVTLQNAVPRQMTQDPNRPLTQEPSRHLTHNPTRQLTQDPNLLLTQDPSRHLTHDHTRRLPQDPTRHLNRPDPIQREQTRDIMPRELTLDPLTRQVTLQNAVPRQLIPDPGRIEDMSLRNQTL